MPIRFTATWALTLVSAVCPVLGIEPLSVSTNGRFLVDSQNRPVFLQGDAAWSLVVGITLEEAEDYLDDRASRGFNVVIVNLIEHMFNGPLNTSGEHPFLNLASPDFTQLNDDYFDHAEAVIAAAQARGIYVLLCPAYLGYPDKEEGWYDDIIANGDTKMRQYGRLIGERFKDYNNIVWVAGGDRNPDDAISETLSMIEGIREADASGNLFTAHTIRQSSPAASYGNQSWFRVSNAYSNDISYLRVLEEIDTAPTRPVFLIEDIYENEHSSTAYSLRRSKWWAATSGTTGVIMGNRPIWLFDSGWVEELDSALSQDMTVLGSFMRGLEWQKLRPDSSHDAVTAGFGRSGSTDYVTAAFAGDGTLLLAYLPVGGSITIDLSKFSEDARFRWFDPATGTFQAVGVLANKGTHDCTAPGQNGGGDPDWVLVGEVETSLK